MLNAGIVLISPNRLHKMLSFLAVPGVEDTFSIKIDQEAIGIHVVRFPAMEGQAARIKMNKAFLKLCDRLSIEYAVACAGEFQAEDILIDNQGSMDLGALAEIQAIKIFAAILKVSWEMNENLLCKSIGFASEEINLKTLDILSEDAACVMIYENADMKEAVKEAIYGKLIRQKGISTVFTKDLRLLIEACDVILTDGKISLDGFENDMAGKLLVGKSSATGPFRKIEEVILWNEALDDLTPSNRLVVYNDALLAVARHINAKERYIDFIKRFPYIYLMRSVVDNS